MQLARHCEWTATAVIELPGSSRLDLSIDEALPQLAAESVDGVRMRRSGPGASSGIALSLTSNRPSEAMRRIEWLSQLLGREQRRRGEALLQARYDERHAATQVAGEQLAQARRQLGEFLARHLGGPRDNREQLANGDVQRLTFVHTSGAGPPGERLVAVDSADPLVEFDTHSAQIVEREARLDDARQVEQEAWSELLTWRTTPLVAPDVHLSGGVSRVLRFVVMGGLIVAAAIIGLLTAAYAKAARLRVPSLAEIDELLGLPGLGDIPRLQPADETIESRPTRRARRLQRAADAVLLLGGIWMVALVTTDADCVARLIWPS